MASLVEELPSDCIQMCLVDLQNPSTMWLVDEINKQISKKFYEVEERLRKVLERGKPQYCNRMLNVGDIVAVYEPVSGAWCRAKICDIYQKLAKYVYSVFLVDRGYSITSDPAYIKELPPEASTIQFRCYHIQLYGIIPISPPNTIASPGKVELQCWLPESVTEVKKLLDTCEALYFTPKVARRTVYGDIYLKVDCGFINLANYLCENKFAVYDSNSFDHMMETAPYMSCQQGFSANNNKESRSISDYIKANQVTDEAFSFQEEHGSGHPCDDSGQRPLEDSIEKKSVENDSTHSNQNKTKGSQRRISALQQYYEEMRAADRRNAGLDRRIVSPDTRHTAQKRHFSGIGRGEKLQLLQKLSAGKKPGGGCSSSSLIEEARDQFEDKDVLVDELSSLSVNGNKNAGYTGKQFFGQSVLTNNVSDGPKTEMDSGGSSRYSHTEEQDTVKQTVHQGKLPMSNGRPNIFCRPSKTVFLPAGSEMSMLVAKKKDQKYPGNFTGKGESNSSNNFKKRK